MPYVFKDNNDENVQDKLTAASMCSWQIDYYVLYIQTVRDELLKHDTTHPFISSSPTKGAITSDPYVLRWGNVWNGSLGDVHYYDYQRASHD